MSVFGLPLLSWNVSVCWAEEMLGLGHSNELVTNERLLELMHPSNPGLPYIYEDFINWGNTATDLL